MDLRADCEKMEENTENVVKLLEIITELNNTSKATHEKLTESLLAHDISETKITELIEEAIVQNRVKKYKYSGVYCYKTIEEQNAVIIRDPEEDVSTQTNSIFTEQLAENFISHKHCITQTEFEDFKTQTASIIQRLEMEVVKLKSELEIIKIDPPLVNQPAAQTNFLQQTVTQLIAKLSPQNHAMYSQFHSNPVLQQPQMPNFVFPQPFNPHHTNGPSTHPTMQPSQHLNSAPAPLPASARTQQQSPSYANATGPPATANNSQQSDLQNPNQQPQNQRAQKDIILTGDSMLNGVHEKGIRRDHFVRVRPHPGATSEDMIDFVLPYARQQPDVIALHVSTNDITKKSNRVATIPKELRPEIDTVKCMKEVFEVIKREAPNTEIIYSLATARFDRPEMKSKINDLNNKMQTLCQQYNIRCLEHKNMDKSCITKPEFDPDTGRKSGRKGGGVHPTPKGNKVLASNFVEGFSQF